MEFEQKNSFATNFHRDKKDLYEKAMVIFESYNPKIKVWIEDTAFDSLGRSLSDDHLSLHTDGGFKGKLKWNRFFKKINKRKLLAGLILPRPPKEKLWKIS